MSCKLIVLILYLWFRDIFLSRFSHEKLLKSNFIHSDKRKNDDLGKSENKETQQKNLTIEEFEDFIVKSGAAGSFMVFRSNKKDDELGIDELWNILCAVSKI